MMHIIHLPVKVCFRVGFDISLTIVLEISERKQLKALIILHVQIPFVFCTVEYFGFLIFQRVKAGILKAFNNPTEKTADEDTKRQVKGSEG